MDLDVDNEQDVLCEKIINDINAVFQKDTDLSSFEIIPTILNCNKTPVIHVEHNLGLESWCIKHVYNYAHKTLLKYRRQPQQRYLQQSDLLIKYLNVALLINPDVSSFWHIRRQLLQKNRLKINCEFQFSALILSKKPKSNEAFAYRRWLFGFQSSESIDWPAEIGICDRCADRSPGNYHAWSHRQWVFQNAPFLIRSELMLSEKFLLKHISDYSSYHYRQMVIARAYQMCYYIAEELPYLQSLKELMASYMQAPVESTEEVLNILLPGVNENDVGVPRLSSFLYCCNLAAHDISMLENQNSLYGCRESFELHRRASLKFIVEQCVRLLTGEKKTLYLQMYTMEQSQQLNAKLRSFDYDAYKFLAAVKRQEGLLGEKHRHWCRLFLGFNYGGAA